MARPGVFFRFYQTNQPYASNAPTCAAKFCGSDSKVTAISKGVPENGKTAALILATWDSSSFRGALNFSKASWASSARAFASAICTLALAMSACATPSSALDLVVSASTTVVRQSDCASRIVVVRHCSNKNAIVAHAPTAVMIPPPKTPFQEIGYQYSAHSNNDGSTATRVSLWFFMAIVYRSSDCSTSIFRRCVAAVEAKALGADAQRSLRHGKTVYVGSTRNRVRPRLNEAIAASRIIFPAMTHPESRHRPIEFSGSVEALAVTLSLPVSEIRAAIGALIDRGYLAPIGNGVYRLMVKPTR
jgi:hypothetical protein